MGGGGGCGRCGKWTPCFDSPGCFDVGGRVKGLFRKTSDHTSSYISSEDIYDKDKSTIQQTMRINNALTDFRAETEIQTDTTENQIIKLSRSGLDQFLNMLTKQNEKTFAGRRLNLNISAIERDNRESEDMIHGFIKKRVMKEVSLDNDECLSILGMEKGEEKKKAMKKFLDKVMSKAITDLSEELRKVIRRQSENVEDRVQVRIDEIEVSLNDNMKKFEKIKSLKETDSAELEKEKLELISVSSICSMGMALLK